MNYRHIHNSRSWRRHFTSPVIILLAFLAAILSFYFFPPRILEETAARFAAPLWRFGAYGKERVAFVFSLFSSQKSLIDENRKLSAELALRNAVLYEHDMLMGENTELRSLLGRIPEGERRIVAAVLKTPPYTRYDTVILDAGEQDGVFLGDRVFAEGVVIGRITETHSGTSVVELFSSAGRRTSAAILHQGISIQVEIEGQGGGVFLVRLPREITVSEGDPVVMPDFNPLLFGKVEAIVHDDADAFNSIYVKNPSNIGSLRFLLIGSSVSRE